ncbi:MAG: signal peptidase I [Oscillospiraceae bacterium]|nr:signal peptidase I [Oscillospiraceae bacterium]
MGMGKNERPDPDIQEDWDMMLKINGEKTDKSEDEHEQDENKTRMELYDWLQCIVAAVVFGIFVFVFIGRTIGVDGASMMDTLHDGDRVIMSNLFYTPDNGDIVVFLSPSAAFEGKPLVKRVIAVAGQSIDINFETGDVYVNGEVMYEPYIRERTSYNRHRFHGPVMVPEGHVFVMGDNRNSSTDSRDPLVGMVDMRYILGRVHLIAIPGEDGINPRSWGRIGLVS